MGHGQRGTDVILDGQGAPGSIAGDPFKRLIADRRCGR
jgi:hypothetical protein